MSLLYWYIGPWQYHVEDGAEYYSGPVGTKAALDFRTLPEQAVKGNANNPSGIGLFASVSRPPEVGRDYQLLGAGNWHDIKTTQAMCDAFPKRRGVNLSPQNCPDLVALVYESLLDADPRGDEFAKPLMPSTKGTLQVRIAGQRHAEIYRQGKHRHSARVLDVIRDNFAKTFARDRKLARKYLDYELEKHGLDRSERGKDWQQFVPQKLRRHVKGPLQHETSVSDDFSGTLAAWTAVAGSWTISSGRLRHGGGGNPSLIRYDTALSAEDMVVAFGAVYDNTSANLDQIGPATRCDSGAVVTAYRYCHQRNVSGTTSITQLRKMIAGSETVIGTGTFVDGTSLQLTSEGSQHTGLMGSAADVDVTDTSITGNLYAGAGAQVGNSEADDWTAADIGGGGGGITIVNLERDIDRGIDRGIWTRGI